MNISKLLVVGIGLALASSTGCTSICSTMLEKNPFTLGWNKTRSRGVPITLAVTTHVDVLIFETKWLKGENEKYSYVPDPSDSTGKTPLASVSVEFKEFKTDKVFTVDPKRPAAGPMNYAMDMNGQYFDKFSGELTDNTIEQVSLAVERILTAAGSLAGGGGKRLMPNTVTGNVIQTTSLRAMARFSLDDPDVHHQISAFVSQHVNGPCPSVMLPNGQCETALAGELLETTTMLPHPEQVK